jgi:translation initiation factor 1
MGESRRVYSTAEGDLRKGAVPRPGRRTARPPAVTVIRGLPPGDVPDVASDLKRRCGSGGAAKDGVVEIQGDHRAKVAARLEAQGYRVKLAGG